MENKYLDFKTNDFILDDSFIRWVNNPRVEDLEFWSSFLEKHPLKRTEIEAAAEFVRILKIEEVYIGDEQIESSLERVLLLMNPHPVLKRKYFYAQWPLQLAASLLLIGGLFLYVSFSKTSISTQNGEIRSYILPDNSTITLNENSELSFYDFWLFRNSREVWLKGEAYFSVKNKKELKRNYPKNFIAYTHDMEVKVLGTTFNIRNRDGKTDVFLNKGKVMLDYGKDNKPVLLTDNQAVSYQPAISNKPKFQKIVKEKILSWRNDLLKFDNTSLNQMAINIEKTTGYKVKMVGEKKENVFISGALVLDSDESLVQSLEFVLQLPVKLEGNVLYISF